MAVGRHPLQRCEHFVPGLRSKPWWYSRDFSSIDLLEGQYYQISKEFDDVLLSGKLKLHPQSSGGPDQNITEGDWNIFELISSGRVNQRNAVEAPITASILSGIPEVVNQPRGLAYFSVLTPRSHILAHCGPTNTRIRIHLGLRVPDGALMRVGVDAREWQEGKCLVFDDSWEHEVFNKSDYLRAVLLLDIWHPDLTSQQRTDLAESTRKTKTSTINEGGRTSRGWRKPEGMWLVGLDPHLAEQARLVLNAIAQNERRELIELASVIAPHGHGFSKEAAEFTLTLSSNKSTFNAASGIRNDCVDEFHNVWLSVIDTFDMPQLINSDSDDLIRLIQIVGLYWRCHGRNLQRMSEFEDEWIGSSKMELSRELLQRGAPRAMLEYLADNYGKYSTPFGSIASVAIKALRQTECRR
jgi:aspartyl/asparaginyl beta-hydroxylase (cupin superfamily)